MKQTPPTAAASACPSGAWVRVALDVPLAGPFDYRATGPLSSGVRVIVPFGRRKLVGVVLDTVDEPALPAQQIRPVEQVLDDMPPLPEDWMRMARFAAEIG